MIECLNCITLILLAPFYLFVEHLNNEMKSRAEEKLWQAESFEFEGGRYRTDTFKIANGKIEFK